MNQLDSDHANALDASVAGSLLQGVVTMASTAAIQVNTAGASIVSSVANGIQATAIDAIISTTRSGISGTVAGAIIASAIGAIQPVTPGGISDGGVTGGIATTTAGGFSLGGGANDWPTFSAVRTRNNITKLLRAASYATGWAQDNSLACQALVVGSVNTNQQFVPLDFLHMGGTMNALTINFMVGQAHSGLPAVMPSFAIYRFDTNSGNNGTSPSNLFSGGSQALSSSWSNAVGSWTAPGSGSAWYASGNTQGVVLTCDQNNLLSGRYTYVLGITDESGTNSLSGNLYLSYVPNIISIPNMAFA